MPVFSCDSGLYFDNVPDEIQPGVYIRRVNGKSLSDDEMIEYYSGLAKRYGDLTDDRLEQDMIEDGFLEFFRGILGKRSID